MFQNKDSYENFQKKKKKSRELMRFEPMNTDLQEQSSTTTLHLTRESCEKLELNSSVIGQPCEEKPILALPIHRIDFPEKLKKWYQGVEKVASGG